MASNSRLFEPLQVGKMNLQHRVVLAPLTRFRADDDHVPLPMVTEYYRQRGSTPGTLLVSEGTFIHHKAGGYANAPGIWSDAQIAAWKKVTDAVHAQGSYIYCQLWALGRAAPPTENSCHKETEVVAPSDKAFEGGATPRALTLEEIDEYVDFYVQAARNAVAAGFDGVEIHGANGYLIDQFTQDVSNFRTDEYGGSVENRSRFGLRVAKAIADAIGAERTGYRVSPWSTFQGMRMQDPREQFTHLLKGLRELNLSYIHIVEARIAGNTDIEAHESLDWALQAWGREHAAIVAGGFTSESAREEVDKKYTDYNVAVAFGRYYISTPDLPFRIKEGLELEPYDRSSFYIPKSEKGYTDYKFHPSFQQNSAKI